MNNNFILKRSLKAHRNLFSRPVTFHLIKTVFIFSYLMVYMGTSAQTITLNKKRISAEKVVLAIQKQSGYNMLYASGLVQKGQKMDLTLKKETLTKALDEAVSQQIYNYVIIGKTIVFKPRGDEKVKGNPSFNSMGDKQDDKVDLGYTSTTKSENVGAYSQVRKEDIDRNSTSNMLDLISTLPGVSVSGTSIVVRRANSITSNSSPLILLDGVEFPVSSVNTLDPKMVQSITVLKDASTTAMYGSRGGNGVISITTRRGSDTEHYDDGTGSITKNKDGSVQLNNVHIKLLMNQLTLWYNVQVIYQSKSPEGYYSGRLSNDIPLSELLYILESAGIKLKREGNFIKISEV